jgi:hypothetical protein
VAKQLLNDGADEESSNESTAMATPLSLAAQGLGCASSNSNVTRADFSKAAVPATPPVTAPQPVAEPVQPEQASAKEKEATARAKKLALLEARLGGSRSQWSPLGWSPLIMQKNNGDVPEYVQHFQANASELDAITDPTVPAHVRPPWHSEAMRGSAATTPATTMVRPGPRHHGVQIRRGLVAPRLQYECVAPTSS